PRNTSCQRRPSMVIRTTLRVAGCAWTPNAKRQKRKKSAGFFMRATRGEAFIRGARMERPRLAPKNQTAASPDGRIVGYKSTRASRQAASICYGSNHDHRCHLLEPRRSHAAEVAAGGERHRSLRAG